MQATVDNLCAERDKLVGKQRIKYPGTDKVIKGPQMATALIRTSRSSNFQIKFTFEPRSDLLHHFATIGII
jgi:hypothetical protein